MPTVAPSPLLVPESPIVNFGFPSPDLRVAEAGPSTLRRVNSTSSHRPAPRLFTVPSPSSLATLLSQPPSSPYPGSEPDDRPNLRAALILRHALRYAVDHTDLDLLGWLISLDAPFSHVLDDEVQMMEDEDGWGLVGMSIMATCGREGAEEAVRMVVGRWGLEAGQRSGRDRGGWTPLHLASLISTPPLISFLLTRGASPRAFSTRGLTPLDLISDMPDRQDVAILLDHSSPHGSSYSTPHPLAANQPKLSAARMAVLQRRRGKTAARLARLEKRDREERAREERERWLRERARVVEVNVELLLPSHARGRDGQRDSGMAWDERDGIDDETDTDIESEEDEGIGDMSHEDDRNDSMLVFALSQIPSILDIFITTYRPVAQPLTTRALPANALFLYARFAHYRCDEAWLEELVEGAVERIEQVVYGNVEDLAHLSFWAYNSTLLLHLFKSDNSLKSACEELSLLSMMEELINAIHVFVIRMAERRIDAILDGALLDYETLDDFSDVRFEGEWSLFRSFAGKKQRATVLPKASQVFTPHGNDGPSSPSILGSLRDNVTSATSSPFKTPVRPHSTQDSSTPRSISADSMSTAGTATHTNLANLLTEAASPSSITDILSGVLVVLQLYDVNPALLVQAFSQIFYWIACELFNRILTRKKYLCRIKAVQIRMNITALEDWVRANGLPARTATKHLEPVTQLLQWLQCSSQINAFDMLIGTMQNLKAINPLQMRRAIRDYRFEVGEGRMTDECAQYLAQLQKDWERRRVEISVRAMQQEAVRRRESESTNGDATSVMTSTTADESTPIDALFDGTTALADFVPQNAPECIGELLDSRYMLPFLLPEHNDFLIATPPADAAFANLLNGTAPFLSDGSSTSSRPPSRSSFSSSRPMGWAPPSKRQVRKLPDDFFGWLRRRESEQRMQRHELRLVPAVDPPLGPSQRVPLAPHRPIVDTHRAEHPPEVEEVTPLASSRSYPAHISTAGGGGFPSPGLSTSASMDQLREKAKPIPFEKVKEPIHVRSESYELKPRPSLLSLKSGSSTAPARQRRDSSVTSPGGSDGGGSAKRWWKFGRKEGSDERRGKREDSEDTVRMEEFDTPMGTSSAGLTSSGSDLDRGGTFWGK